MATFSPFLLVPCDGGKGMVTTNYLNKKVYVGAGSGDEDGRMWNCGSGPPSHQSGGEKKTLFDESQMIAEKRARLTCSWPLVCQVLAWQPHV